MPRFSQRDSVLALVLLALILRLVGAGNVPLTYDESFTWATTQAPDFWGVIAGDVHPPLYYALETMIARVLGDSLFALRVLSILCGTLGVVLVYRIARQAGSDHDRAALAALFAATMPALVWHGQNARMYPLLAALVLGMIEAQLAHRWSRYAILATLALYTHNLAFLYALPAAALLAQAIPLHRPQNAKAAPIIAAAVPFAVWLPFALTTVSTQAGSMASSGFWLQAPRGGNFLYPLISQTLGHWSLGPLQMHATAIIFGVTIAASLAGWSRVGAGGRAIYALVFVPPVLALAISAAWIPIYLDRVFIVSAYLLAIVWAIGVGALTPDGRRLALAALALALAVSVWALHTTPRNTENDDLTSVIAQKWQGGDCIYHTAFTTPITARRYLPADQYTHFVHPHAGNLSQSLTPAAQLALGLDTLQPDEALDHCTRVWLIWLSVSTSTSDHQHRVHEWLSAHSNKFIAETGRENIASAALYLIEDGPANPAQLTTTAQTALNVQARQ